MGWSVEWRERPRAEFIKSRLRGWDNECAKAVLLAHSDKGNHLWKVYEITVKQGERAGQTERFIAMDQIIKERGQGWGYKDQEEGDGLSFYDCPLKFLDMVPEPTNSRWAAEWRQKVRAHHAKCARKRKAVRNLRIGQVVSLLPGHTPKELTIISLKPLRGSAHGLVYKLRPGVIAI